MKYFLALVVAFYGLLLMFTVIGELGNLPAYQKYCSERDWVYAGSHNCLDSTGIYYPFSATTAVRMYRP